MKNWLIAFIITILMLGLIVITTWGVFKHPVLFAIVITLLLIFAIIYCIKLQLDEEDETREKLNDISSWVPDYLKK